MFINITSIQRDTTLEGNPKVFVEIHAAIFVTDELEDEDE